jgi:hypothetical protein
MMSSRSEIVGEKKDGRTSWTRGGVKRYDLKPLIAGRNAGTVELPLKV